MCNTAEMTLEERITRLEDIEAIRQLQAKYQRCLDCRDFEGVEDCFTEDVDAAYDNAHESYKGRDNVMAFLRSVMTTDIPSSHLIHGGEIDVLDKENATAKWYLEDFLLHRKFLAKLHGTAIYDVRYIKQTPQPLVGGDNMAVMQWKICKIGYTRCYEYFELRGLVNILTLGKTTFLDLFKKYKGKNDQGGIKAHIRHFTK